MNKKKNGINTSFYTVSKYLCIENKYNMGKSFTTQEFIDKAKIIHGNRYDYSKTEYLAYHTPLCIICSKHSEFWQTPANHLKGCGCPKCGVDHVHDLQRRTVNSFINKANVIHDGKYDYSKVDYINDNTKVCIICPEHGEFWQTPNTHLNGSGCPQCGIIRTHNHQRKKQDTFISEANKIHNNKYDYSKVEYKSARQLVCIICPEHGEFWQTPSDHLRGRGCKKCAGKGREIGDVINEFNKVHNSKYDYSLVKSTRAKELIKIICPIHGVFLQILDHHRNGCGCPKCKTSTLEKNVMAALDNENINYVYQKKFDWLINVSNMRYDFYLPKYKAVIECQGAQHFKPIDFFGGDDGLKHTKLRDEVKEKLSEKHGIKVYYYSNLDIDYPYKVYTDINELLNEIINNAND